MQFSVAAMPAALGSSVTVEVAGRTIRFTGDSADPYFLSLPAFHASAPSLERYLARSIAPDAFCLDIGSNIGLTAILMALYCPAGEVICFEGSPRSAAYLRKNLALNSVSNCRVVEAAVGERQGNVLFRETAFGAGSHVTPGDPAQHAGPSTVVVPMVTLDAYLRENGCADRRIDFIKLDVEGFEPAVLAGARRTIETSRCPILMEFNSWCLLTCHNFNPLAFATALASAFDVHHIGPAGELVPIGDGSVGSILQANLIEHRCVDDLLVRVRPGAAVPPLDAMTKYGDDLENAREMRRKHANSRGNDP
jgi:FkbM family methyltransferase